MSSEDAARHLTGFCQEIMRDTKCDFDSAWQIAKQKYPQLFDRVCQGKPATALANSGHSAVAGCNVSQLSPAQARSAFQDFIARLMTQRGIGYTAAWNEAARTEPHLLARSGEELRNENADASGKTALPNALYGDVSTAAKPLHLSLLGLPGDASDDEYRAAFVGNGRNVARRNSSEILGALIGHAMASGLNVADARRHAKGRYPTLWQEAQEGPL